jgi:aryl-alcohol dehydrogenase-like predicted oxidoreductase
MKIGIGSAQFGMDYGISNRGGATPAVEVRRILEWADGAGVRIIDTAPLYGAAEEVLGRCLPDAHRFDIVTKTPSFGRTAENARAGELTAAFERSLARLGAREVYGLLVHHADDLLSPGGSRLFEAMLALKRDRKVRRIGASVYEPGQVDRLLERFAIDLIQVPVNILDQRLLAGGQLARLKGKGVEVHARSAFLQGVLLMEPGDLPAHFDRIKPLLRRYRDWMAERGLDPVGAAVGFVTGLPHVDAVIIGVNTLQQLAEVVARSKPPLDPEDFRGFAVADPAIINPTLWPEHCDRSA